MSIRAASVIVAFVFAAAVPALAQRPGQPPANLPQLAADLADLRARVAKLEGNIVAADLAGTYTLTVIATNMSASHPGFPPVNATINTAAGRATVILNADGTGTTAGLTCEGSTLTQGSWAMHGFDCSEPADDVTWTYADGVMTITFLGDGDEVPFTVALGGRLLITAFSPFHPSDPSSDHALLILTRLK